MLSVQKTDMSRKEKKKITESRRLSSISSRLQHRMFGIRFFQYLAMDILLLAAMILGYAALVEGEKTGDLDLDRDRTLVSEENTTYYVVSENGEELFRLDAEDLTTRALLITGTVLLLQMFFLLVAMFGDYRSIRKTLRPLNELALKADQLSHFSYADEERIALIEDAIDHINPDDESPLSIPDNDLAGIELAMNNLIQRMKESHRQQTRFVNDASHELRTPIAVIQGYASMLDRWGRDDPEVLEESIQAISHEADHMNRLVEQLLFLARGDSGRTTLKPVPLSLPDMMEEIYEESVMIDEKHIYRFKKPADNLTVSVDETLLKQAVRILLDNAAKYTEAGSEIILSTGLSPEGEPYLQVQDTGIGMSDKDVRHMFERFYRSDETREIQGTGLGLSIAKWIVDRHGGHFEILSRSELGTRIRILLPAESITAEPVTAEPATAESDTSVSAYAESVTAESDTSEFMAEEPADAKPTAGKM